MLCNSVIIVIMWVYVCVSNIVMIGVLKALPVSLNSNYLFI